MVRTGGGAPCNGRETATIHGFQETPKRLRQEEISLYTIDIPGRSSIVLTHAVFDFNGTLAFDGALLAGVEQWIEQLRMVLTPVILTADTFGTAKAVAQKLGCSMQKVVSGEEKAKVVMGLRGAAAAVGNGQNDVPMFKAAALSIAVLGPEGASSAALMAADVVVGHISDAMGLLLNPTRLAATLRS